MLSTDFGMINTRTHTAFTLNNYIQCKHIEGFVFVYSLLRYISGISGGNQCNDPSVFFFHHLLLFTRCWIAFSMQYMLLLLCKVGLVALCLLYNNDPNKYITSKLLLFFLYRWWLQPNIVCKWENKCFLFRVVKATGEIHCFFFNFWKLVSLTVCVCEKSEQLFKLVPVVSEIVSIDARNHGLFKKQYEQTV